MSLCQERYQPCFEQRAWGLYGGDVECSDCREIALAILQWWFGPMEFFIGEWMTTRRVERIIAPLKSYGINNSSLFKSLLLAGDRR